MPQKHNEFLPEKIISLQDENKKLVNIINFMLNNMNDVQTVFGELVQEKMQLKETVRKLEDESFEFIKIFALMQKEANKFQEEKSFLLESENDILHQLGQIAEEKKKIEKERELLEEAGMDMARSIGEIFMEKQTIERLNEELEIKTHEANTAKVQIRRLLNKIFPEEIASEMIQGNVNFNTLNVTISFSDLKSFSNYAVNKKPEEIAYDLKNYFNDVDRILKTHNGWLVKYIGDSVMMLFGVPYLSKSHAMDAVLSAFRIKEVSKKHPWNTRFGINTGLVTVGDIGSIGRPQYDAIGDAVNVAARLERFGKKENSDIVITVDTYVRIHKFFHTRCFGEVSLKGVGERRLYEVTGLKGIFDNDLRIDENSLLAKKYSFLEDEIKKRIKELFPKLDMLNLESKDGTLNHALAVSVFAVALKRELKLSIDEDKLIIAACTHDLGKIYIKSSILNKEEISKEARDVLSNIGELSEKVVKKLGKYEDIIPLIREMHSEDFNVSQEAKILKICDAFDSMIFPKYYIVESKSLDDAEDILNRNFPYKETETFLKLIRA